MGSPGLLKISHPSFSRFASRFPTTLSPSLSLSLSLSLSVSRGAYYAGPKGWMAWYLWYTARSRWFTPLS